MTSQRSFDRLRRIAASIIALAALLYIIGVLGGHIPESRKLTITDLAIIAVSALGVTVLLRPDSISRLKLLEMGGFKLELLERVKEQQKIQENRLEDIIFMLPLLLPETERKHLMNIEDKKTNDYQGNGALRAELRRLRSIGLIQMTSTDKHIAQMTTGNRFNLADYVKLTPLGERWVQRIKEIEKEQSESAKIDELEKH